MIRVLIGALGPDGGGRGTQELAKLLQDDGYEVIYTGPGQSPEQLARAALQEAVDAIGLAVGDDAPTALFPELMAQLRAKELGDLPVFGGGGAPAETVTALQACGVNLPEETGAGSAALLQWLAAAVAPRPGAEAQA
jgi:methylmalonyl-CoA mutase C-terminal domain/subunit